MSPEAERAQFVGEMESDRKLPPHSEKCHSIIVRSEFDLSCPLCSILHKVIMLRRRTITNGSSMSEMETAFRLAIALIAKYQIPPALLNDRLYTSPTQSEAARALKAQKLTKRHSQREEF